jgi:molybdopterin converting factor small subunit
MKINVKCFASLSTDDTCRHDQLRSINLDGKNATVANLIDHVRLPKQEIATVFVNGRRSGINDRLADGDRVAFVPAIGGM